MYAKNLKKISFEKKKKKWHPSFIITTATIFSLSYTFSVAAYIQFKEKLWLTGCGTVISVADSCYHFPH